MSVLSFPRLYFRGTVSWDPIVSNNDPETYDGVNVHVNLKPGETTADFRKRMIATTRQRGDWNYFGTHTCVFEQTRVTGGELQPRASILRDDELLYTPVELIGKLVDIDPAGICSQLFFDELSIGVAGRAHLRAVPHHRMSARWLNFRRNLGRLPIAGRAAASWQAVFPREELQLRRAESSPLLQGFTEALHDPHARGLMLRICTYRTQYFQNGLRNPFERAATLEELQRLHEQGKAISNPAYSLMVGVMGVWRDSDNESVPGGRLLLPGTPAPVRNAMGALAGSGPAVVEFDRPSKTLSIDLSSAIPEIDADLEKADFGPLSMVVSRSEQHVPIARIDYAAYDRAAYEARAGIIDIDVSAVEDIESTLASGTLSLHANTRNGPVGLLTEQEFTAVSDDCNIYLDEGDVRSVSLRVHERGRVPSRPVSVLVATYDAGMQHTGEVAVLSVSPGDPAIVQLRAESPGYRHLGFTVYSGEHPPTPPPVLQVGSALFTSVRTLPFDDTLEAETPDTALTWEFIYAHVLQVYDAIAPRMSTIIKLDDPDAVATFARRFKEVTAERLFESRHYMPITRDLSRGKRKLLHRFCDLVITAAPVVVTRPVQPPGAVVPAVIAREPLATPAREAFEKRAL